MLVELNIVPLSGHVHISQEIAEVVKLIDESGLRYRLMPSGTCIEGGWDEVMSLVRRCHERARSMASHVITTVTIEDEEGVGDKLVSNITSIEEKIGHPLRG